MKIKIILSLLLLFTSLSAFCTIWTVGNAGATFTPDTITINPGDTVNFILDPSHDALEVSQSTWNLNDNTPLFGGFLTPYGGGLVLPAHLSIGTHYYVCEPHASMGMKAVIIVQSCNVPAQPIAVIGNASICAATSNIYNISAVAGATSYTWTLPVGWTGSSVTNSITAIAGTTSGNISVTANNSCGSSLIRTLAVSSNTVPVQPGTVSGTASICATTSNIYNISAVSGATSYTWTLPVGWTGSSTSSSITAVAGTNSGNISVTANNSCGSSLIRTLAVSSNTVPVQPGTISGTASICATTSNIYNIAAVSGATSYTWTLPVGWTGSSITSSITAVSGTASGNISVTANNSCGSSLIRTLSVSSNTVPVQPGTISGNTIVCDGSSVSYSITSVAGANAYSWTLPIGWTGSSTTNSITAIAGSTSGNISVSANNACGSSALKTLNVIRNLIDTSVLVSGLTLTANATSASYQWINCNGNIAVSGQINQSFTATTNGNYAVIITKNGCSDTSSCYSINIVGLNENNPLTTLHVFPNPSNGKFTIETAKVENSKIEIYNMMGELFFQSEILNHNTDVDISHQPKGIYFVKIHAGQSSITKKIIVQ